MKGFYCAVCVPHEFIIYAYITYILWNVSDGVFSLLIERFSQKVPEKVFYAEKKLAKFSELQNVISDY